MQNVSCSPMGLARLFPLTQREGCSRGEDGVCLSVCHLVTSYLL